MRVAGGLAEDLKTAAIDLEREEALVAQIDVFTGFHFYGGCDAARSLHVIKREDVGIGGGTGLFKTAEWHL